VTSHNRWHIFLILATFTHLMELFDLESEDEMESLEITDEFSDFPTMVTKGPKLDDLVRHNSQLEMKRNCIVVRIPIQ
jgi:hypothetical protein